MLPHDPLVHTQGLAYAEGQLYESIGRVGHSALRRIDVESGVVQDHLTLGFTYKTARGGELTFAYMHAFSNSVSAPTMLNSFVPPGVSAGSASFKMYQNAVGIAYGWRM